MSGNIEQPKERPGPVLLTKAADITQSGSQTDGMIRSNALVDVVDNICSSVMRAHPHTSSAIHHHGSLNTMIYAVSGHGTVVSEGGKVRTELAPGDFAMIPAWAEHQEVNESGEDVVWVIVRSGRVPVVENLEGWGRG